MVVVYSASYNERWACQWELMQAYLAGSAEGAPADSRGHYHRRCGGDRRIAAARDRFATDVRKIAGHLRIATSGESAEGVIDLVAGYLAGQPGPSLWIVDDLSAEVDATKLGQFVVSDRSARMLFTARSRGGSSDQEIPLRGVTEPDGVAILRSARSFWPGDRAAAAAQAGAPPAERARTTASSAARPGTRRRPLALGPPGTWRSRRSGRSRPDWAGRPGTLRRGGAALGAAGHGPVESGAGPADRSGRGQSPGHARPRSAGRGPVHPG